jgi:hypothetical protein
LKKQLFILIAFMMSLESPNFFRWILDSGATFYMINNGEYLFNITEPSLSSITVASGKSVNVEAIKNIDLVLKLNNGQVQSITLKKVFYFPKFTKNLVSIT